jgi:hypothetical protein
MTAKESEAITQRLLRAYRPAQAASNRRTYQPTGAITLALPTAAIQEIEREMERLPYDLTEEERGRLYRLAVARVIVQR